MRREPFELPVRLEAIAQDSGSRGRPSGRQNRVSLGA